MFDEMAKLNKLLREEALKIISMEWKHKSVFTVAAALKRSKHGIYQALARDEDF